MSSLSKVERLDRILQRSSGYCGNTMIQRFIAVFFFALAFNFIWEELHSILYLSYRGGEITHIILLRAALYDAAVTVLFLFPFLRFDFLKQRKWLLPVLLTVFAVLLEKLALGTGRWAYAKAMPIIPLLNVGLTPAIQLGLLGFLSFYLSQRLRFKR